MERRGKHFFWEVTGLLTREIKRTRLPFLMCTLFISAFINQNKESVCGRSLNWRDDCFAVSWLKCCFCCPKPDTCKCPLLANRRYTVSGSSHRNADRRFVTANARFGGARSRTATTGMGLYAEMCTKTQSGPSSHRSRSPKAVAHI